MRISALVAILIIGVSGIFAQEAPKLKVTPAGRLLIDGALYASPEKYLFGDGVAIPEARVGAKLNYGKWSSWVELGFAYGKIGMRNLWIQYDFNDNNNFRIGNFLQPFGLQAMSSVNVQQTFEQPVAAALFRPGLQLGAMYTYKNESVISSTSLHAESSALTNVMNYPLYNKQGYSLISRFVWHSIYNSKASFPLVSAGLSIDLSTPERRLEDDYDVHDGFTNSAVFPTKVSTETALSAIVADSRLRFKFSPEIILSSGRLALESQYFFQTISRKENLKNYNAYGAYVNLRGILTGGNFSYDKATGQLVNPKNKTLECVIDYNYSNLCDSRAAILGGRANSFNITLNYYFNQYFTAKLNYAYTYVWEREGYIPVTQNVFQARIMLLF